VARGQDERYKLVVAKGQFNNQLSFFAVALFWEAMLLQKFEITQ
jgi:hypothetical protein